MLRAPRVGGDSEYESARWPRRPWWRRLLVPPGLWRVERYLITHHPLLWRSRLLLFVLASAVGANLALGWVGARAPIPPDRIPLPADVGALVLYLRVAGVAVLLAWAYVQLRSPLHELSLRRSAVLTLAYAACIFSVLANPVAFVGPYVERIAGAVSDEQLEEDRAFYAAFAYWGCAGQLPLARGSDVEEEVAGRLERYDWSPYVSRCTPLSDSTAVISGSFALAEQLDAALAAKAFRDGRPSAFRRHHGALPQYGLLSVLLAAALTFAVCFRNLARRWFDFAGSPLSLGKLTLPLFGRVRDLDERLLVNRPLLWAVRAHAFAFYCLTYGVVALGVAWLVSWLATGETPLELWWELFSDSDLLFWVNLLGPGVALAFLWAVYRRHVDVRPRTTREAQLALVLFLLSVSCPLLLAGGAGAASGLTDGDIAFFLGYGLTGAFVVAGVAFAAEFLRRTETARVFAVAFAAVVGGMWLGGDDDVSAPWIAAWFALATVVLVLSRRHATLGRLPRRLAIELAAALVIVTPWTILVVWVNPVGDLDWYPFEWRWWKGDWDHTRAVIWVWALSLPFFAVSSVPATRILMRARAEPRAE